MAYSARAVRPYPMQRRHIVVLPNDAMWCSFGQTHYQAGTIATAAWTTGDTAVGFWITAPYDCTVYQIGWFNGNAAGGDTDVAIYDSDGTTRLVSTGATTGSGNSIWQFVNTTDQTLIAGKDYFVAMNHSTNTVNQVAGHNAPTLSAALLHTVKIQAVGATALPDPFVPADPTVAVVVGIVALMLTSLGTS